MDNAPPARKPLYKSLYVQAITANIIGVLPAHFHPGTGEATIVVANWTGDLDQRRMQRELDNASGTGSDDPARERDLRETHMPVGRSGV